MSEKIKYEKMSRKELQEELAKRNLLEEGKTAELIARLEENDGTGKEPAEPEAETPAEEKLDEPAKEEKKEELAEPEKRKTREEADAEKAAKEEESTKQIAALEARLAELERANTEKIAREIAKEGKEDLSKINPRTSPPEDVVKLIDIPGFVKVAEAYKGGKAETMLRNLAAQPKRIVNVPVELGEKRGKALKDVQLNGCKIHFKKGYSLNLPIQVAEIVEVGFEETENALHPVSTPIIGSGFTHKIGPLRMDEKDDSALSALS